MEKKKDKKYEVGLRKEKIPLFLSDLVVAGLMFFLFKITQHYVRWLFLFIGLIILAVGLMGILLKPRE